MSLFDAGEQLHPNSSAPSPVTYLCLVCGAALVTLLQSSPRGSGLNCLNCSFPRKAQKYQVKGREKKLKSDIAQTHETLPQQDQWADQGEERCVWSDWDGADELQGLDLVLFCYQHLHNLELITGPSQHL